MDWKKKWRIFGAWEGRNKVSINFTEKERGTEKMYLEVTSIPLKSWYTWYDACLKMCKVILLSNVSQTVFSGTLVLRELTASVPLSNERDGLQVRHNELA